MNAEQGKSGQSADAPKTSRTESGTPATGSDRTAPKPSDVFPARRAQGGDSNTPKPSEVFAPRRITEGGDNRTAPKEPQKTGDTTPPRGRTASPPPAGYEIRQPTGITEKSQKPPDVSQDAWNRIHGARKPDRRESRNQAGRKQSKQRTQGKGHNRR